MKAKVKIRPIKAICPECSYALMRAQAVGFQRPPRTGDVALCGNCGTILVFTSKAGGLRRAAPEDLTTMATQDLFSMALVQSTVLLRGREMPGN